ncbi:MAG: hypothetical protein HRS57_01980 [Mycoplasmataceae bacterium]|nr:hypothetical protein [Mycoplasmataceae bacterium]
MFAGKNLYNRKNLKNISIGKEFFQVSVKMPDDNEWKKYYYDSEGSDYDKSLLDIRKKSSVAFLDSKSTYEFQNLESKRMSILRKLLFSNDNTLSEEYKKVKDLLERIEEIVKSRKNLETKKRLTLNLFKEISQTQFNYLQREKYTIAKVLEVFELNDFSASRKIKTRVEGMSNKKTAKDIFNDYKENIDLILLGKEKITTILKDKLIILSSNEKISDHLSKGEIRILLSLLTSSVINLSNFSKKNKYLLLDDFFSELSEKSIILVINSLKKVDAQIFITNPSSNLGYISDISYKIKL